MRTFSRLSPERVNKAPGKCNVQKEKGGDLGVLFFFAGEVLLLFSFVSAVRCCAVRCCAVRCCAVVCCVVRCCAVLCGGMLCCGVRCGALVCCAVAVRCCAVAVRCCAVLCCCCAVLCCGGVLCGAVVWRCGGMRGSPDVLFLGGGFLHFMAGVYMLLFLLLSLSLSLSLLSSLSLSLSLSLSHRSVLSGAFSAVLPAGVAARRGVGAASLRAGGVVQRLRVQRGGPALCNGRHRRVD